MATIYSNPRTDEYEILHDAYYGSGMFASGAAITPHRREGTDSIKFRRQIAYYLNYTGPIINASVDPILKMKSSENIANLYYLMNSLTM